MKRIKYLFIPVALIISSYANADDLMTCNLPSGKVATISSKGNQAIYSFSKAGAKPDVQFDQSKQWFMGNNHYAGANYQTTFRIMNGEYAYIMYSQNYGTGLDEGLVAFKGDKVLFNKKCTNDTGVSDKLPFGAKASDYGMKDETDGMSDLIGKLDQNSNIPAHDANTDNSDNTQSTADNNQPADASQIPVKVQIQDVPYDWKSADFAKHNVTRHIYVYSLVDSITITGLSVDRGSCYDWNNIKPYTAAYGKRADFYLPISESNAAANAGWNWYGGPTKYGKCMWSEIVVKTNMGNYTFNMNQ